MHSLLACARRLAPALGGVFLLALASACGPTDGGPGAGGDCEGTDFTCGSGECIPRSQVCNGSPNCSDGTDEDDCLDRCEGRTDYRCKDGTTCISTLAVCDGREDCPGGDDEDTCGTQECDGFQCSDGSCLDAAAKCNGDEECPNGEDESAQNCAPTRCPNETDMRCRDGKTCVTEDEVCDGTPDCPGEEDESESICANKDEGGEGDETGGKGQDDDGRPDGDKPGGEGDGPDKPGDTKDPDKGRPCVSIDEKGVCDGEILVWCDHGELAKKNCAREGKTCGRKDAETGNVCLETENTPEPPDQCGDITAAGRCEGSTLTFCSRGRVRIQNCARRNKECRMEGGKARCLPPADQEQACADVPPEGRCDGDTLVFCDEGETKTYDCAASGMTCDMEGGEHKCVERPCGDVTYEGTCDGDVLSYCAQESRLVTIDCQEKYGLTCSYSGDDIGYNCRAENDQNACGDITYEGTCDGDTVLYCDNGSLHDYDCSVLDKECGMLDSGIVGCQAPADACGDVDFYGECQGDTAVWCKDGALKSRDCGDEGMSCGLYSEEVGYWCLSQETSDVPAAWSCPDNYYEDSLCDCGCGAPDPACDDPNATVFENCPDGESCQAGETECTGGTTSDGPPSSWTCLELYWNDEYCDCGCGAPDPTCDDPNASVFENCPDGQSCQAGEAECS